MKDQSQKNNSVNDPELKEWLDALENIINEDGNDRASFILGKLASKLTESGTIPDELPLLSGPVDSEQNLLNRFNSMQEQVQSIGFNIASLFLDNRRAWSFHFKNGIKVILGRRDFEERFNRVLTLIPITTSGRIDQIESIDMRYTNGFSILWKK